MNKNFNIVSKTLIYGALEAIPCAPEFSIFGTVGTHEVWSCEFRVFEINDFGTHPDFPIGLFSIPALQVSAIALFVGVMNPKVKAVTENT